MYTNQKYQVCKSSIKFAEELHFKTNYQSLVPHTTKQYGRSLCPLKFNVWFETAFAFRQ
jgi:hypothetical protein